MSAPIVRAFMQSGSLFSSSLESEGALGVASRHSVSAPVPPSQMVLYQDLHAGVKFGIPIALVVGLGLGYFLGRR